MFSDAPKELVKELNRLLFKSLWNGTDKVTRVSAINRYGEGGLKTINLNCMHNKEIRVTYHLSEGTGWDEH